ncbi:hypothetical protein [Aquamicrobium zhengzhouense]|uniref:Uncharacterized protein n=1 Tax=Aquamicrobium zhengzhouense TaxID=2781738 RepID=A0ABS0SBT3_9HYPH|nr:hypothetical protein [Aquamicrobium zhengzhouense]MBI1620156.1 hypothetical protein [Aquamicrobium zhengzhouense]
MSLARIALRIAAVEAIKGRTLVGDNVLDSPNGALDVQADGSLRSEEEKPFISIYTDSGKVENVASRQLNENGICDIVFEMGISQAMTDLDRETGVTSLVGIGVPASDRAFEFFLDVVQRQMFDALNDPEDPWAEIYRGLQYGIRKIEYAGARNTDDGQKLAGHQVRITLDLIDDPVRGEVLDDEAPFQKFLKQLEASSDPVYRKQGATIRSLITAEEESWQQIQRRQGMTADELLALGLGPVAGDDERATPEFAQGHLELPHRANVVEE